MTAEFDSFYLISGYVPNSGDGLKRLVFDTMHLASLLVYFILFIIFIPIVCLFL